MKNERKYLWGQNQKLENIDRSKLPEIISQGGYKVFLIAGPNGVGKGTIIQGLLERNEGVAQVIRTTTKLITSEENQYHQVTIESFFESIDNGRLVEWGKYGQGYYGTRIRDIALSLGKGKKLVIDIDIEGGIVLRSFFENLGVQVFDCFISPVPEHKLQNEDGISEAVEILRSRLITRNRDEGEVELAGRLRNAEQMLKSAKSFRHIIVNEQDNLNSTLLQLESLIANN